MSSAYNEYIAFIPAKFAVEIEDVLRFCLSEGKLRWSQEGVTFEVLGYEEEFEEFSEYDGDHDSGDRPYVIFMTLMRDLMQKGRISLTFVRHIDHGDDGDYSENAPDFDTLLESCPTLILREVLAKRLE